VSAKPSLDDYIDVAERIAAFIEKYPDGSLQRESVEIMDVTGKTFVVYKALAFREPDDRRPGQGTAWEPFPGPTPYTRDSELMNAETAAWGRAIVALGITSNRKIASRQEVAARDGGQVPAGTITPSQQTRLRALITKAQKDGMKGPVLRALLDEQGLEDLKLEAGWMKQLSTEQATEIIDVLVGGVLPDPSLGSDIPTD
jgi:hypothetical protein